MEAFAATRYKGILEAGLSTKDTLMRIQLGYDFLGVALNWGV
jgi:hypothetical protein